MAINSVMFVYSDDAEKETNPVKFHAESCVSLDGAAIRYTTAHGTHGALKPFATESEHEVFRRTHKYLAPTDPLLVR